MLETVAYTSKGKTFDFPILSPGDYITFTTRLFERGRVLLMKDLDDSKASPDVRFAALEKYRELEGTYNLLLRHVKTYEGTLEVLKLSASRMASPPDIDAMPDGDGELTMLAGKLCGFQPNPKAVGEPTDDDDGFVRPTKASPATG